LVLSTAGAGETHGQCAGAGLSALVCLVLRLPPGRVLPVPKRAADHVQGGSLLPLCGHPGAAAGGGGLSQRAGPMVEPAVSGVHGRAGGESPLGEPREQGRPPAPERGQCHGRGDPFRAAAAALRPPQHRPVRLVHRGLHR
ncbi:hypothetical protein HGM15179_021673, partial [Zosterops borbonicus]